MVRRRLTRQAIQYTAVVGTTRIDGTCSAGSLTTADQQRQVAVPARGWIDPPGPMLGQKSAHDEPRQNERHYIQARLGAVRQRRGARGLGAGGPARDHKPPLNICQASQNPCRLLGKALSEFLESISRTQHRTILPMPPDQHHADGQSSGHTCWDTDRGMASDVEGASIG